MRSAAVLAALAALAATGCKSTPRCVALFARYRNAAGPDVDARKQWFLARCEQADPHVALCPEEILAPVRTASEADAQRTLAWQLPGCVQRYRTLRARDEHVAEKVAEAVRAGQLAPGRALLPPDLETASFDSTVWIANRPGGALWLFFPTWRGRDRNVAGYLWSSTPLPPATGAHPTMVLPGFCFDDACKPVAEPEPFSVEKVLDPHWRFVRWAWD